MSFFKRSQQSDVLEADDHDANVDPELRLRTVRTAASTIAESIRSEQRAERRKSLRQKRSRFFRTKSVEKKGKAQVEDKPPPDAKPSTTIPGVRRNIYVNTPLTASEVDNHGEPLVRYVRNKVRTSSTCFQDLLLHAGYSRTCRVHHHHFPTQESLRAIQEVSSVGPVLSPILKLSVRGQLL